MKLLFEWVREETPGPKWRRLFEAAWPAYRKWYLIEGSGPRPDLDTARARLAGAMPELVPTWERLVELAGGDELAARMLSLWDPPPFLAGCTQAAITHPHPALVRNYDFHPEKTEALFLRSAWSGRSVLASSDCLWGVLDGMNDAGLVVALSFAGRRVVGEGFGITLILRYVLETCTDVEQAIAVLRRVPSHMAYNVSLLDTTGRRCVAELAPDHATRVRDRAVSTNHQRLGDWPEYEARSRTVERRRFLERRLADDAALDEERLTSLFLEPPLFQDDYDASFGTLYTATYRPDRLDVRYSWRGLQLTQPLEAFEEREVDVPLGD